MAETKVNRPAEYQSLENIKCRRPAHLEIDLGAFAINFNTIKQLAGPGMAIMAVVKANAYGHGSIEIALQAEKLGADFLGVAFIEEGEELRQAGVKTPIVVLYPDLPERASRLVANGFIATADSKAYLEALNEAVVSLNTDVEVFIKVETGMGRYGADINQLRRIAGFIKSKSRLSVLGVSTNLADSSNGDSALTDIQFSEFIESLKKYALDNSKYVSIENSSGLLFHHNKNFNLVRIGLLLYGYAPKHGHDYHFMPVMSLKSSIIQLKEWPAAKPIGYGATFKPSHDIKIATLGVGYADGYPWALSNKGYALVRGCKTPIVGRICMDAMMIDVTGVPDVRIGDEAVLLGKSGNEIITADDLSSKAGSFSYELLAGMSKRLPRIYGGK